MRERASSTTVSVLDRPFGFSAADRVRFMTQYVLSKVFYLWRDVQTPRLRLFVYEMIYSAWKVTKRPPLGMRWLQIHKVKTIFGTFNVRPGTMDVACVSPAFERPDLDLLLTLLEKPLKAGQSVLFLDIGADLGTYSVAVAKRLHETGDIRFLAFEPSQSSFAMLGRNLEDNDLTDVVRQRQLALGDGSESSMTLQLDFANPAQSSLATLPGEGTVGELVTLSTLDEEILGEDDFDVLVIKMDVEGSEVPVLMGAAKTLRSAHEVLLMVEDFLDARVVNYLESTGWKFTGKLTPYNSFWSLGTSDLDVELDLLDGLPLLGVQTDDVLAQVPGDLTWVVEQADLQRRGVEELLIGGVLQERVDVLP
jgi:FkbM family methyltransferase